jgi:hypothetical protein
MTREDAATYLELRLGPTRDDAGVLEGDWELAIDDALLALGVTASEMSGKDVADGDVIGYRALLTYYGLTFLHDRVLNRIDISGSEPSMSLRESQIVTNLERRIATAQAAASGYAVAGSLAASLSGYGQIGTYNADFLTMPGSC